MENPDLEMSKRAMIAQEWFQGATRNLDEAVQRLSLLVDDTSPCSPSTVGRIFVRVKQIDDALEEVCKTLGAIKTRMQYTTVPTKFETDGTKTLTTDDGFRITTSQTVRASIIDKPLGFQWLRDNELGDIIVEQVNASTLSATAKHMMENEGRELPETLFRVEIITGTSVTAVKSKK